MDSIDIYKSDEDSWLSSDDEGAGAMPSVESRPSSSLLKTIDEEDSPEYSLKQKRGLTVSERI